MRKDAAIEYADQLLYERTGKHLNDLQSRILQQSWQGHTYGQVASSVGYSEGHVKDVASQLWKTLSEALGERITKGNLRSRLINRAKRTFKHAAPDTYESIASVVRPALPSLSSQPFPSLPVSPPSSSPDSNPHFLGRLNDLETLSALASQHRIVVVKGEGGIGKTTLAQQYAQQFERLLELPMAKERENITPAESVVAEWLRQHFDEEPGGEFGVTLSRLKQHLHRSPQRIGILIDNLEPALDSNGQFVAEHRHYVELLRSLAEDSSASATVIITSRDRLCEPGIKVHHYPLPALSTEAWQAFFLTSQASTYPTSAEQAAQKSSARIDNAVLSKMHRAYGGNAKAMEILCAAVVSDYEGDLSAYWRDNSKDLLGAADLRNLVVSQVNRLQQLDAAAYRIFCRLGCYRYQEQPTLRAAAITALMWDIEPHRQQQTLHSLRDRSLLEFRKGDYWLHPVSRAEAIKRLREGDTWQAANITAAQYWNNCVETITTTEAALKALEAYYHYMAAKDYSGAAGVLLKSRHNQWQQFLPLASSLYRMGFLQPVIHAITQVLPFIQNETLAHSELNNILGDVYWITGKVHSAIRCQQQTLADIEKEQTQREHIAPENHEQTKSDRELDAYYQKMLTVDAHLSIGLYSLDLWELARAQTSFEQVIRLAAGSAHQAWADKAAVGLALTHAYAGAADIAAELANSIFEPFMSAEQPGQYAYFLQLLGRTFDVLGDVDKAKLLYERAIAFAQAGHYVQVKAQALGGLASIHRKQGDFAKAHLLHQRAIEQSEIIGAKCDLAEAYFQAGISKLAFNQATHQAKGVNAQQTGCAQIEPSRSSQASQSSKLPISSLSEIDRAIALFSELAAPNQIQRVKNSVSNLLAAKSSSD